MNLNKLTNKLRTNKLRNQKKRKINNVRYIEHECVFILKKSILNIYKLNLYF